MTDRQVVPVPVSGADGSSLLGPLRDALSGAGPALAPHPRERGVDPAAVLPLGPDEDDPTDPVAAVVSTTGSTGTPKHVLLGASALLASAAATHDRLGGAGRWLLAVPAHTVAGMQVVVRSLVAGTTPTVVDLAGGFTADGFARDARPFTEDGRTGRRYASLVPTQLVRLLDAGADPLAVLRRFDAVLVGGAALGPALRARAQEAGVHILSTYGMTETAGGCVYDGVPLPGVRLRIEDDSGRIVVGGPVLARGYRGTASEDFLTTPEGRWFRTADVGTLEGGLLQVQGRVDDVVVSGGTNVSLGAVERVAGAATDVGACVAVALPDAHWGQVVGLLVQPASEGLAVDTDSLLRAVREQLGRAAVPRRVRTVPQLPLAGVGKPDRTAAEALLLGPGPRSGPS